MIFSRIAILFFLVHLLNVGNAQQKYAKEDVLKDLNYLNASLLESHYNLFAFTSGREYSENIKKIEGEINKDSLSLLEVHSLFQRVVAKANTGHCEIDFPVQLYKEYVTDEGSLFPLEIAIEEEGVFIRANYTSKKNIKGMQLVSINEIPIQDILEKIYPYISAERVYLKNAKLEFWSFPRLYWQVFGENKTFKLEIKSNSKTSSITVNAVRAITFEKNRTDFLNQKREFKFINQIAYLNPSKFSVEADSLEKVYKYFIDSCFLQIKKQECKRLIIDLRNNPGGDNELSDYLLSYIATKPFKWNSSFKIKTSKVLKEHTRQYNDTNDVYFRKILDKPDGFIYGYKYQDCNPKKSDNHFTGKVYVLINRQTYSMAAITAAIIKDYKFGKIMGEETGDTPTLHGAQFAFSLPLTKINVKVPKGYIIRPNGSKIVEGVIPDIIVTDHLLDNEDEILESVLLKITNE